MAAPRAAETVGGRKTGPFRLGDRSQKGKTLIPAETRNGLPEPKFYPPGRNQHQWSMTEEEAAVYLGSTWRPEKRKECS